MNSKPFLVALTGGIASGKSQASQFFAAQGIQIVDADKIARELFAKDSVYLKDLRTMFGNQIFVSSGVDKGQLNRPALAQLVFKDQQKLEQLNQLSHPLIFEKIEQQVSQISSPYGVLDIPLLVNPNGKIALHYQQLVDRILVIETEIEPRIKRLASRDGLNQEAAMSRINTQASNQQRRLVADDLLLNNQTLKLYIQQLTALHHRYLEFSTTK